MPKPPFFLTIMTVLFTAQASPAAAQTDVPFTSVAERHCPAPWRALSLLEPTSWEAFGAAKANPALAPNQNALMHKYSAAIVALADYTGAFIGFSAEENQTPRAFKIARAKYDLALCLMPTQAERDAITALAQSQTDAGETRIRETFFKSFDQFNCMGFPKASEAILSLDPAAADFSLDYEAITEAHMKTCPAP